MKTGQEYIHTIAKVRELLKTGDNNRINRAEEQLIALDDLWPHRLEYFLAKVELMSCKNSPRGEMIRFLEEIPKGLYCQKMLVELYESLSRVVPEEEILKKKKYEFLSNFYMGKDCDYIDLKHTRAMFLEQQDSLDNIMALAEQYYIVQNLYMYFILMVLWCKLSVEQDVYEKYIAKDALSLANVGYLFDLLLDDKPHTFLLVQQECDDSSDYEVLMKALISLGKSVIVLQKPVLCEVHHNIAIEDTLKVSLENAEEINGVKRFYPIRLMHSELKQADNIAYLVDYITTQMIPNHLAIILGNDYMLDRLQAEEMLVKNTQRLSIRLDDRLKKNIGFGWSGDYLSYISNLYNFDVHDVLEQPAECEFSIVIPVRNSIKTLRYTLQTCLEQRYQGEYEILLSDNSTDGNEEVYQLYCELNDSKIRYIKTPKDLPLAKSFEFAFLQAKGEFVFSIGSDDGVLPWALETLHEVLQQIPEEDILLWNRGFYAWPGFNGGQENQFTVENNYRKRNFKLNVYSSTEWLSHVVQNVSAIYGELPMLYLNSGYRRRYLNLLLKKYGRLWDTAAQDIYMGVVNLAVTEKFARIEYPITIAGMSGTSIGASAEEITRLNINNQIELIAPFRPSMNRFVYVHTDTEEVYPNFLTVDLLNFYWAILKMMKMGLMPDEVIAKLDWKDIFITLIRRLVYTDLLLDKKLKLLQQSSKLLNEEIVGFVNDCCEQIYRVHDRRPAQVKGRLYTIGFNKDERGLTLDASQFGVKNIHEAVKLFEKLTGL